MNKWPVHTGHFFGRADDFFCSTGAAAGPGARGIVYQGKSCVESGCLSRGGGFQAAEEQKRDYRRCPEHHSCKREEPVEAEDDRYEERGQGADGRAD